MADFFGDLFDAFTGQETQGQQTITPTNEALSAAYGTATGLVPQLNAYNQAMATGQTQTALDVANMLDPNALANLRGANASILEQLSLGSGLGQELQEDVIRNALEGSAASGFGVGVGGRGLVARDLGLTGLNLQRQRQQDALDAGTSGFKLSRDIYRPSQGFSPQDIAYDQSQVTAAMDAYANEAESIRRGNFASLLNTGGRIIGGIVGGIATSGSPQGIETGKAVGGSIFAGSTVSGQPKRSVKGGGGGMTSMLSGLGGMGGGGGGGGGDQMGSAAMNMGAPA